MQDNKVFTFYLEKSFPAFLEPTQNIRREDNLKAATLLSNERPERKSAYAGFGLRALLLSRLRNTNTRCLALGLDTNAYLLRLEN